MKTNRFPKILSAMLCVAVLLSMLMVGALFSQAGSTHDAYMYKLTRKAESGDGKVFFNATQSVALNTGDTWQISFLYNVTEGSKFLTGGNLSAPFDFGLLPAGGSPIKIVYDTVEKDTTLTSADANWRRIEYTFAIPEALNGKNLDKFCFLTVWSGSTDVVYVADLKLCKVTDGVAGETILPGIGSEANLSKWLNSSAQNIGAETKFTHNLFDMEVLPFKEELFKTGSTPTPTVEYMYKFDRGTENWSFNYMAQYLKSPAIEFHEGETYRISCYYNKKSGSLFGKTGELATPMEFFLRYNVPESEAKTAYCHVSGAAERGAHDPDWRYLALDVTIPAEMDGRTLSNFGFGTVYPVPEAETIYVAKVALQKVTDGVAGENLVPDICKQATLVDWYTDSTWVTVNAENTSMSRDGDTLTILPYDETLFKRPADEAYTVTITGGKTADGKTSYKPGEKVTIIADEAPAGQTFDFWACVGASLDAPSSATTWFYMDEENVILSAEYADANSDNGGDNGGGNTETGGNQNTGSGESPRMGDTFPYAVVGLIVCAAAAVSVMTGRKLRKN